MRICIVSAVFPPESVISSQTSAQLVQELTRRGHSVTVVTDFPNKPAGILFAGYRRSVYTRENRSEGFEVVRCFSFFSRKSWMFTRLLENISFGVTTSLAIFLMPRPDVLYVNTWPIFAAGMVVLAAMLRRIPIVNSVQDVYPESVTSQGRIHPGGILMKMLRELDGWISRNSDAVITISERFAQIYREQRKVAPERVHIVPNWMDQNGIHWSRNGSHIRQESGIPGSAFLCVYGGNVGVAAAVETLIHMYSCYSLEPRPYLLIAGGGAMLGKCRALASEIQPNNIRFLNPWPFEKTGAVFEAANILLLPTKGDQSLVSVPSKIISYMLAGKPILALVQPGSDVAALIETAHCGWVIAPDRPDILAAKVEEIGSMNRADLKRLGTAGRSYALKNLTRDVCAPRVVAILEGLRR
jgi:colanic acid biosynthesis glycosyl transferase WcaI